jgi:hypothetical protein
LNSSSAKTSAPLEVIARAGATDKSVSVRRLVA